MRFFVQLILKSNLYKTKQNIFILMVLIIHFFIGFFTSFLGSITPSMLNMTALKVSLKYDEKAGNKYALGVSVIVLFQAYIAILLSKYILENPAILETIEKLGVVIFMVLTYYFYRESKKDKIKTEQNQLKKENPFFLGITLSVLNMFAIPFFFGVVAIFNIFNVFSFDAFPLLFFMLGSVLGTYFILYFYAKYAKNIQQKTGKLTKDINLVLSLLTAFVAVFSIIKLLYKFINS